MIIKGYFNVNTFLKDETKKQVMFLNIYACKDKLSKHFKQLPIDREQDGVTSFCRRL